MFRRLGRFLHDQRGLTLIELLIALTILSILGALVLPMAEMTVKRSKELELKRSLRIVRTAIDNYKSDHDFAVEAKKINTSIDESGYPEELEVLLELHEWGGAFPQKKRYLRRIPKDPFDVYDEGWGLRAFTDDADSTVWGGDNIYDVYSQSDRIAIDKSYYKDW